MNSLDAREERQDAALIRRAQRGDTAAFSELYRRHSRWVYGVALRIVGNATDAEDVTQDTFVQVWKALPGFRQESELRTWIHRICTHRCLRVGARASARRTEELSEEVVAPGPDPADVAVARRRLDDVQRAVDSLPPTARAALVLREWGDLSYAEVAEALGITLTAARTRIHRARLEVVARLEAATPTRPSPAGQRRETA